MSGPDRPDAADEHLLCRHRVDHLLRGAFGIQHKKVCLGWREGIALAPQPIERLLTNRSVDELSLRNQMLVLEAGDRKSTRLNSSHPSISYAVFFLKKKI